MIKVAKFVLLACLLLMVVEFGEARGGRGGGGGGRSSGGGGRGSGSKGGSKGSGSNGSSGSRGIRPTSLEQCRTECYNQANYHQKCIDDCSKRGSSIFGWLVIGLCGCCYVFRRCQYRNQSKYQSNNPLRQQLLESVRSSSIQYKDQFSPTYEHMKAKYEGRIINFADNQAEYILKQATELFQRLIVDSSLQPEKGTFKIFTDIKEFYTKGCLLLTNKEQGRQSFEIFKGKDQIGSYMAKGEIIYCKNNEIGLWFMKVYDDREGAGQTGKWRDLIFQSTYFQPDGIKGQWYYLGFEDETEFAGKWEMRSPENEQTASKLWIQALNFGEGQFNPH